MLQAIKQFFDHNIAPLSTQNDTENEHALQLATAALLFEMMRMDDEHSPQEQRLIQALITRHFTLSDTETEQLLALAEQEAEQAIDYHQFTSLINANFSIKQKIRIVEQLWQIAFTDGEIHKYEEHLVRKVAELLYVSHSDFIAAKHRAMPQ
ncbi:hypothetical protein MNBD_GAMMA26-2443 [hydrothermal vent metagenome]|uniref:Co-chaperone DjlA N-terminal domain-containing protein n=1 Tax=hydrothermal vent metagenome TaxID=652676 RepID=A0A3B1BWE0_9ZZZZ